MTITVTPIPQLVELAAPSFTLGTANAAGSAATAVASDSTLLAFDAVAVDAITLGQSGSVGTATVAPRRDHAHAMEAAPAPVFGRVVRTAGDVTTTSTSLVDFTGATITFATGVFPVHFSATQVGRNSTTNQFIAFNVDLDGGLLLGSSGMTNMTANGGDSVDVSFSGQTAALTAASHTIKLQWRVSANTGTVKADSNGSHIWSAFEIR
jgi:hypothetical protein